jgi:RNA polymerase sigma factor (sigma-70 family)
MNMDDTQQLLTEYVDKSSESAFRALVARYINPVYSTALRLADGHAHLAEDITQTVFADLARKAAKLPPATVLGGWLHRHTCFVASKTMRGERRRQFRERQAAAMNTPEDHTAANLDQVAPILDEAINQLEPADRTAILLRFFDQLEFRAIGEKMGSNEDAARMRVNRALEKMEVLLKHRGVTLSTAALGTALAIGFVSTAPIGLAATVAATALAGASAGGITTGFLKLMTMTHLKIALISTAAIAVLAVPAVVQHQSLTKLRVENQSLSQQITQLTPLQEENQRLSNLVAQTTSGPTPTDQQVHDLARLRGQVALLSQQTNDLTKALSAAHQPVGLRGRSTTGFAPNGKRTFRHMTMPEFTAFIAEVLQAPVADQTGMTGYFDIEMTPPRIGAIDQLQERVTGILRNELGLQLLPFAGPFTAKEVPPAAQNLVQNPDGTWVPQPTASIATNVGFAIKLENSGAPGLKTSDGQPFPDEQSTHNSLAQSDANALSGLGTDGLPPLVANKLRLIDSAKQQWALEQHKQNKDTPTWDDLRPYLAQGASGDMRTFTDAPEATYVINSVDTRPSYRASASQLAQAWQSVDKTAVDENACINNLRLIDSAKQQWALEHNKTGEDTPTWDDIKPYLGRGANGEIPVCPDGGVYTIGKVGEKPTCSIPSHVLP